MAKVPSTSSEHTAGPWEIVKHGTPEAFPQYGVYAFGQSMEDHCIVKGENALQDARLIAAAPDLLKLAFDLCDRLEKVDPEYYSSEMIAQADDLFCQIDGSRDCQA